MTRTHKLVNLAGIVLPFLGLVVAIVVLWERMVGPTELAILAVGYVLTGVGITVGYHRLFTHRSFETYRGGALRLRRARWDGRRGRRLAWVSDHRKHHQFSDQEGDPHSPHVGFGDGSSTSCAGFWHAHSGWLFSAAGRADQSRYAKDLVRDRGMRVIAKLFLPLVLFSLAVPAVVGWLLLGGWYGFFAGLFGAAPSGSSCSSTSRSRSTRSATCGAASRFASRDESRNVWWLSWLSFGESWHNNHHAFPSSAFHGLRAREIDPGGWLIWLLERVGLAWNVVRIPPEKQARKLATH